jgi:6-phosphogluconate dehydrogenase
MESQRHEIGMIGLGVTWRNMLLNMADHGYPVAGYDKDPGKVEALQKEFAEHDLHSVANIKDFIGLLRAGGHQHHDRARPTPTPR